MDSLASRRRPTRWILIGLLVCGAISAEERAAAQPPGSGSSTALTRDGQGAARSDPAAGSREADPPRGNAQTAPAQVQPPRREPSQAYRDSIRKTLEKRRQRRARRALGRGPDDARPVGAIVPWPMPPALIIRQTPEVHGELDSLLGRLRR